MTKAKARARAKARATAKASKPAAKAEKPESRMRPGRDESRTNAMRNIGGGANFVTMAGIMRGSARSR